MDLRSGSTNNIQEQSQDSVPLLLQLVNGNYSETKSKAHITHEKGVGSPCEKCKNCSGLDLHFWRKVCKNCGCKYEDHKVVANDSFHNAIVHNLLHMKTDVIDVEDENNNISEHPYVKEFTTQTTPGKYQSMQISFEGKNISSRKRSARTTSEEMRLHQILVNQIPPQDFDPQYCHDLSEEEKEEMALYLEEVQTDGIGKGYTHLFNESHDKLCAECNGVINCGTKCISVGSIQSKLWHHACFKCYQCKQALADEIYFKLNDRVYCGRHFGEAYKKRCASCDELIFSTEYTDAEDREWHKKHFCCFSCDQELSNKDYVYVELQPYCLKCHDNNRYALHCYDCNLPIAVGKPRFEYAEKNWHVNMNCLKCYNCNRSLIDSQFVSFNQLIYCSEQCTG